MIHIVVYAQCFTHIIHVLPTLISLDAFFSTQYDKTAQGTKTPQSACALYIAHPAPPFIHTYTRTLSLYLSCIRACAHPHAHIHTHTHTHLLLSLPCRRRRYLRGCLPPSLSLSLSISLSLALHLGGGADTFEVGARLQRLGEVQQIGRLCLASKR